MPSDLLTFFSFVSFLLDVLVKKFVRDGLVELKDVEDDVVMPIFLPLISYIQPFTCFFCKDHDVVNFFHIHLSQVDFYVADSSTGHGLDGGQDVMDNNGTIIVGSINAELN